MLKSERKLNVSPTAIKRAWLLAVSYGHGWTYAPATEDGYTAGAAVLAARPCDGGTYDLARRAEEALRTDVPRPVERPPATLEECAALGAAADVLNINRLPGIGAPTEDDFTGARPVHVTATGRTRWWIDAGGSVVVVIERSRPDALGLGMPGDEVLQAHLSVEGALAAIWVGDFAERHVGALQTAIDALRDEVTSFDPRDVPGLLDPRRQPPPACTAGACHECGGPASA